MSSHLAGPAALVAQLPRLKSNAAKRALVNQLPPDWVREHATSLITSTEAVLRQRAVKATCDDGSLFLPLVEALRNRLEKPVASPQLAETLTDGLIRLLSAPRLAKRVKQLSHIVRARALSNACSVRSGFSLPPHPKLKTFFKDIVLTQTMLLDPCVPYEIREIVFRLAPPNLRESNFQLILSAVSSADDVMWGFLERSSRLLPDERHQLASVAAMSIISDQRFSLEARAKRLATVAATPDAGLSQDLLLSLSAALYERGATLPQRSRLLSTLLPILSTVTADSATRDTGFKDFQAVLNTALRLEQLSPEEFLNNGTRQGEVSDRAAWLHSAVSRIARLEYMPDAEVDKVATAIVLMAAESPDILLEASDAVPRSASLLWCSAVLTAVENFIAKDIPGSEFARNVGQLLGRADLPPDVFHRVFEEFVTASLATRDFWSHVLDGAGLAVPWQPIVTSRGQEILAIGNTLKRDAAREGFSQGYTRATVALQEKLKALTRAARVLSERLRVAQDDEVAAARVVLNDLVATLAAVGIRAVGDTGASASFDPAIHDDVTGTARPGQPVVVRGPGFVVDELGPEQRYLAKIPVPAWG